MSSTSILDEQLVSGDMCPSTYMYPDTSCSSGIHVSGQHVSWCKRGLTFCSRTALLIHTVPVVLSDWWTSGQWSIIWLNFMGTNSPDAVLLVLNVCDVIGRRVRSGAGDVWWWLSGRIRSSLFSAVNQRTGSGTLSRRSGRSLRHNGRGSSLLAAWRHSGHLPTALRLRLHCRQSLGTPPLPRNASRFWYARCR